MGCGGRRPGAGAPTGNLNAFKHGRNSRQYKALLNIITRDPQALLLLRDLADHNRRRRLKLRKAAQKYIDELLARIDEAQAEAATRAYENNRAIPPILNTDRRPK